MPYFGTPRLSLGSAYPGGRSVDGNLHSGR